MFDKLWSDGVSAVENVIGDNVQTPSGQSLTDMVKKTLSTVETVKTVGIVLCVLVALNLALTLFVYLVPSKRRR